MKFLYEVPPHLEGHLGNMDTKALKQLTTNLYEIAISQRLLTYPKLHIEKQVDDLVNSVSLLLTQNDKLTRIINEELATIKRTISEMSAVRIESSLTPKSVINRDVEALEDGGEEGFYSDLRKQKEDSGTEQDSDERSEQDLIDDLLA